MNTRVVTVEADDTLGTIQTIFSNTHFHHLLVVDNKQLAGVISDRDLLRHLSPYLDTITENNRDRGTVKRRAHQIMSRHLHTLRADQTLGDVVALFTEQAISCIPILNEHDDAVGIISWHDILQFVTTS